MRIGVLTLPLHTNYGGILQAYALQTVLERMGHDVDVFQSPFCKKVGLPKFPRCIKVYLKRIVKNVITRKKCHIRAERYYNKEYEASSEKTRAFIKRYIHEKKINSLLEINELSYDCIVVGSDQVWRPVYFKRMWNAPAENMFLAFLKRENIVRVAYAPSFGVDRCELANDELEKCRKSIQLFNCISVREKSGIEICENKLGVKASLVLDPTMLLQTKDYVELIEKSPSQRPSGNLLTYILDDCKWKNAVIDDMAKKMQMKPFEINSKVDCVEAPFEERCQISVEAWLRSFWEAEFVITDSFHACVFSILFEKPFLVLANRLRGTSRLYSLLEMFNKTDCLIGDISEYSKEKDYRFKPDYSSRLEILRMQSVGFLFQGVGAKYG